MSQNDFTLANQSFPAFRADLNSALQALASNSSGGSAPSTTFANMWWYDTSNNIMYIRNEDNDAWIKFAELDQANDKFVLSGTLQLDDGTVSAPALTFNSDTNTGIYRGGTDILKFVTAGTDAVTIDANQNFMVGTTDTSPWNNTSETGILATSGGVLAATSGGDAAFYGNRLTGDGDIIQLRKTGVTVGSIGVTSGVLTIDGEGANTGGFYFNGANNILPRKNKAFNSGTIDLGSTGQRWKDIFLSGTIDIEQGSGNVAVGKNALSVSTGDNNTAIGKDALINNSTAIRNVGVGKSALYNTNTGSSNTAVGWQAGYNITSGTSNVLVGQNSGSSLQTVNQNTFIGGGCGSTVTTGANNTIIGGYNGNSGGLDIRTSSNNIVLSDGDGNPRLHIDGSGVVKNTDFIIPFPAGAAPNGTFTHYNNGSQQSTDASHLNMPVACALKVKAIYLYVNSALSTGSATVSLQKNGGGVASISVTTGVNAFNSTGLSVSYVAADRMGIKIVGTSTSSAWYNVSVLCERA